MKILAIGDLVGENGTQKLIENLMSIEKNLKNGYLIQSLGRMKKTNI